MYDQTQLLKGILEGCILKILSKRVSYGYEIVTHLNQYGFSSLTEGTVYPLMLRLEKKGLITADFRLSPNGPSRKYYRLTEEGKQMLADFDVAWRRIADAVDAVWKGADEDECI